MDYFSQELENMFDTAGVDEITAWLEDRRGKGEREAALLDGVIGGYVHGVGDDLRAGSALPALRRRAVEFIMDCRRITEKV